MAFQYGMLIRLSIMLLAVLVPAATSVVATTRAKARQGGEEDETDIALPGCKAKCGNVTIPYPFGIGDRRCYFKPEFQITCSGSGVPRLMESRVIVTDISLEDGELQTTQLISRDCYDRYTNDSQEFGGLGGLRVYPPYTVSGKKNRMFVIGCDTYAKLVGSRGYNNYTTGCISECQNNIALSNAIDKDDSCSGMGCCESKIPPLLNNLNLKMGSFTNYTRVGNFDPCGYSFIVKRGNFTFSNTSFQQLRHTARLPLVLDWQIMEESCEIAMQNKTTYACKGNSICHNKASGYICLCMPGFQGNPYLPDGCQDINECASYLTPCKHGKCVNLPGNYSCTCDSGYKNLDGRRCIKVPSAKKYLKISLGASFSFLILLAGIFWTFRNMTENKLLAIKNAYFKDNAALLFREKLGRDAARIFTEEQLKEATHDYHESRKVGEGGGYGIFYKGILDKQLVAIKKSKLSAPIITAPATAIEPSINEMIVLSQINHKNVVRLVGCCFGTRTPIQVYEFIANGTLYERIHEKKPPLSLELRMQIASEAADALAYLHHSTSTSIIHGDVKTASILLAENFTAKLWDFGASKLVPKDENQPSTLCQGTKGYLDPENTLTKKSDVYSFGVVLAELLTSRKPEEERNLANVFVSKVKSRVWDEILDQEMVKEIPDQEMVKSYLETAKSAAELAIRCLRVKGEERPSMKEVAAELEELVRTMEKHPSGGEANITPSKLDDDDGDGGGGSSGIITSVDSSILQ